MVFSRYEVLLTFFLFQFMLPFNNSLFLENHGLSPSSFILRFKKYSFSNFGACHGFVWRSDDILWESILSFCYVGPRDRTQSSRLGDKCLMRCGTILAALHPSLSRKWLKCFKEKHVTKAKKQVCPYKHRCPCRNSDGNPMGHLLYGNGGWGFLENSKL